MSLRDYKSKKGRDLFERFKKSSRWEVVEILGYGYDIYSAIFRDVNNGKFVFLDVDKSNSGKTEYWSFSEEPKGLFLVKIFKSSPEWEELEVSSQSARNDHDFRKSSNWIFQNNSGKKVCISSDSKNRSGNSTSWYFNGNLEDIPAYDCLLNNNILCE